jgi:membrane protease YdiL (CAAX protease family)
MSAPRTRAGAVAEMMVPTGVPRRERRRRALLAVPVLVPVSMAGAFPVLQRLLGPRRGYNAGFALYWVGWCLGFPLWVVGPRRLVRLLRDGARPSAADLALLAVPVVGAAATELAPMRRAVDPKVAVVMVATAAVNAVGEELLWRGTYLDCFPEDPWRGAAWPCIGFTVWHLAPQIILPSRRGRAQFLVGAGLVGAASARVAWKTRGLRWTLPAHVLTDACGVRATLYRLGHPDPGPHRPLRVIVPRSLRITRPPHRTLRVRTARRQRVLLPMLGGRR